ncbi:peptidoglycan DD-metalloendopeptidase family protein [Enterococcus dongliensis]|uniref:Peptidoglycan DD-metalloendopeptidase family protein n=1 Tax=Enterococcus dongliensis TaxID=2559925 RepID=A0AAW8TR31_9ENTE|nr:MULTISPECIES: peptidoglycan DD-metalloendopeptidase family protein [Enterococcus]MDT2635401.1 peptidoglycan DD-metalloendopeptidase family protein [Enterococcus dongliensis]MDT2638148.1 peptidoglycan DD-metalloendopeptidase family protein [Enterococcus dongliensis]MDT2643479.1 peptidoglycan DD-metalloendopeptidase family protein [Enterococcus dongliensis]MDT2648349.1 peptidoglycan DD-metalloendopeptidase family protein [Enterococcus dongliensis]MDT2670032.1 peptidoglycan DD-metalloendopepti
MKKISKLLSAIFLITQAFLAIPLNTFADTTTDNPAKSSEVDKSSEEETESSSMSSSDSSEEITSSSKESESSTKPSETSTSTKGEDTKTTTSSSATTTSSSSEKPKVKSSASKSSSKAETPATPAAQATEASTAEKPQETPTPQTTVDQSATAELNELIPASTVTDDGSIHFEKDESVESFIRKIGDSARKIGKKKDLYGSVMIAQAILESASGQSKLAQAPNYNLFGIKGSHHGKSVSMATQEDLGNGDLYTTQAGFKVYENYEDSFNDYATLLKEGLTGNSRFYEGVWKSNAKTYKEATKFLTGRYATDTQYNKKLNGLIETYDLTQYDKEVQGAPVSANGYQVPVAHYTISSGFGNRGGEFHRGLDLAANQGEPIHATKAGTVLKAEYHYSWGNYVVIQHDDGMTTLYAHQQQYVVKAGDTVSQGQTIGYVGTTGNSTGPHLHLEVNRDSSLLQDHLVDPQPILFGK